MSEPRDREIMSLVVNDNGMLVGPNQTEGSVACKGFTKLLKLKPGDQVTATLSVKEFPGFTGTFTYAEDEVEIPPHGDVLDAAEFYGEKSLWADGLVNVDGASYYVLAVTATLQAILYDLNPDTYGNGTYYFRIEKL